MQKPNIVNGEDHFGPVACPFWPGQCSKVDVTGYVEEIGLRGFSFVNNPQAIQYSFAKHMGFLPNGSFQIRWPSSLNFCKRILDTEITELTSLSGEPRNPGFRVAVHHVSLRLASRSMTR